MIKARNRKLAMILVVAMLMTLFAGIGTAGAATTYSVISAGSFGPGSYPNADDPAYKALGTIEVKIENVMAVAYGATMTVSLPTAVQLSKGTVTLEVPKMLGGSGSSDGNNLFPNLYAGDTESIVVTNGGTGYGTNSGIRRVQVGESSINITFGNYDGSDTAIPGAGQGLFYIRFSNVPLDGATEDIVANISGSTSAFTAGTATLARVSGGATTASIASVKNIGPNGGKIDTITIQEARAGSWTAKDEIRMKLPAGFAWPKGTTSIKVTGMWAFQGIEFYIPIANFDENDRTIQFSLAGFFPKPAAGLARIDISLDGNLIVTDDAIAKMGEVIVTITGRGEANTTDQDLVIANRGDYAAIMEEVVVQDVLAGWDTDLNKAQFKMVETLFGSLISGRTVTLTLPDGAKWNVPSSTDPAVPGKPTASEKENIWPALYGGDNALAFELLKGSPSDYFTAESKASQITSNNGRTLKYTIGSTSTTAWEVLFKRPQISIRADFSGPLEIEVGGNAGVEGKVKVAEVSPGLVVTADADAQIIIGAQNQPISDILLTEGGAEAIDTTMGDRVELRLPLGTRWATKPTVEVIEGDIVVDSMSVNDETRALVLTFRASSTVASVIKLSNIAITADRTVPEGDMKLYISTNSTALTNNSDEKRFNIDSISATVIGQCVTPAPSDVISTAQKGGEIKIGSGTYYANGSTKPASNPAYIENDRTLVAQRDLADILGADIVWNQDDQTVTLTKGDTVVVFTIGSTEYTVTRNGESRTLTADVAPQLVNDYTMLPARYAAEAFGASVTWDPIGFVVYINF